MSRRFDLLLALAATITFVVMTTGCQSTTTTSPRLVAASNMKHPPFSSWSPSGRAVGIEVDIVESAAQSLGYTVEWVERPFAELLDAVASREIDVAVSTIGITDERRKLVALSDAYFETTIVALVRPGSSHTLDSLATARIGADRATTSFTAARKRWPNATITGEVAPGMTWPDMVASDMIDAFIVDASDQQRLESESGVALQALPEPLTAEYFGVAMQHEAFALRQAINVAVARHRKSTP